jgi:gliding motility-associated lipoprotein GldH
MKNIFVNLTLFTVSLFLFSSCEGHFQQKWTDIPLLNWKQDNVVTNEIEITDTEASYQVGLGLRYLRYLSQKNVKVSLETISPSGKTSTENYEINLKDENGDDIGEVMAELVDIEQVVIKDKKFEEKGKYIFKITQMTGELELEGIVEVGLILDKNKM